jgi:hypothetical protein
MPSIQHLAGNKCNDLYALTQLNGNDLGVSVFFSFRQLAAVPFLQLRYAEVSLPPRIYVAEIDCGGKTVEPFTA